MKKVIFVFAFAMLAAFSYASVVSLNSNTVVVEMNQEEPKADKAEATDSKSSKDATASSDKKSECSSKKKSSCSKSCSGK